MSLKYLAAFAAALLVFGCVDDPKPGEPERAALEPSAARDSIKAEEIRKHVEVLSSDAFEGRGPDSEGAKLATAYLKEQLQASGLKPGNHGAWSQDVPLRKLKNETITAVIVDEGEEYELVKGRDFVAENRCAEGLHRVDGDLVLVGHGVQAPEFDWDDYKGLDCKGKVLVMFVGDPPAEDRSLFGGDAMTLYGRWTYKFNKARELGAAGCVVIHKTQWAGYGWSVVANSWNGVHVNVRNEDGPKEMAYEGWVSWEMAEQLVSKTGKSLDELAALAATRDFQPVALGKRLSAAIKTSVEEFTDQNVVAIAEGNDPFKKSEFVIVTAHWDHLGKGEGEGEDLIYNGAVDNASGCGLVLELAEAFAVLKGKHARSVMFLFVCSEEQGLLGSLYYSQNPIIPPAKTIANINVDGANLWDKTTDVEVIGKGQSELDEILSAVLEADGRVAKPDSEPAKGLYYRSDHFNFARIGIPALYTKGGIDVPGQDEGYLKNVKDLWTQNDYHRTSDELNDTMTAAGAEADGRALFSVIEKLITSDLWPAWSETSEFRATSLKNRKRP